MKRRTLLKLGVAATAVLAVAGTGLALIHPARRDGKLTPAAQTMLLAVAQTVLSDLLPADAQARAKALSAYLGRLSDTIAGMPTAVQAEIDELLTIVTSAPGRRALVGLSGPWAEASSDEVASALQTMRSSSLALRQQAFHALRDLTNGAYFADRSTWAVIGYPGPRELPGPAPT
jgi:hypothetical protein